MTKRTRRSARSTSGGAAREKRRRNACGRRLTADARHVGTTDTAKLEGHDTRRQGLADRASHRGRCTRVARCDHGDDGTGGRSQRRAGSIGTQPAADVQRDAGPWDRRARSSRAWEKRIEGFAEGPRTAARHPPTAPPLGLPGTATRLSNRLPASALQTQPRYRPDATAVATTTRLRPDFSFVSRPYRTRQRDSPVPTRCTAPGLPVHGRATLRSRLGLRRTC